MKAKKIQKIIDESEKIVLKVGSSILINQKTGEININWLNSFAEDLLKLLRQNGNNGEINNSTEKIEVELSTTFYGRP